MTTVLELRPTIHKRIIDLVETAGIDISDWSNFQNGLKPETAASNPKYCYDWSFEDREKQITVLCLWYENLVQRDNDVIQILNLREDLRQLKGKQAASAQKMDFALQRAHYFKIPLRVVICDEKEGKKKEDKKRDADFRLLDSELWHIESYSDTGQYILVRGNRPSLYVDQFDSFEVSDESPKEISTLTTVYERSQAVRMQALVYAQGKCEWCGASGFVTSSGQIYLETHHIVPLSENGVDHITNVIALCPNHHREAHFGQNVERTKRILLEKTATRIN